MTVPLAEVDLGSLAPAERNPEYAPRLDDGESESHRALRLQLEDQLYEAEHMREWYERAIKGGAAAWENVEAFASWTARVALVRDRIERCGFARA